MPQEMVEQSSAKPRAFREAATFARKKRPGVSQESGALLNPTYGVPQEMYNYIFVLQVQNETPGPMDYRKYAGTMWEELAGQEPDSPGFEIFQEHMIANLHNIKMKDIVFPHLSRNMSQLVETYKHDIESVNLWSTGDVSATGYQPGKIEKSGIIRDFLGAVRDNLSHQEKTQFIREKTNYLVDDNKFSGLVEHTGKLLEADPEQPLKFVIIEDSFNNFKKAKDALDAKYGEGKVEVVPIWFTGSREGLSATDRLADFLEEGADDYWVDKETLDKKKAGSNAIATFDELLDRDRFGPLLKGAHVMVDFDGVICDNVKMRQRQASAVYNSLLDGIEQATGDKRELAAQRVFANIPH
jgi:hypothetical protein